MGVGPLAGSEGTVTGYREVEEWGRNMAESEGTVSKFDNLIERLEGAAQIMADDEYFAEVEWPATMFEAVTTLRAERALADDLADVLALLPSAVWELLKDFDHFDEVERAMARWREARGL